MPAAMISCENHTAPTRSSNVWLDTLAWSMCSGRVPTHKSVGTIAETVDAEDLASLPAALRDAIERAVVSLDPARIAVVVSKVSKENGPLGIVLEHLADKLAYSRILRALQRCKTSLTADSSCDREPVSDASTTVGSESR